MVKGGLNFHNADLVQQQQQQQQTDNPHFKAKDVTIFCVQITEKRDAVALNIALSLWRLALIVGVMENKQTSKPVDDLFLGQFAVLH